MEQSPSWEADRFSASQKFLTFYGTRNFITAVASARHLSLSWTSSIQSLPLHPTSWRSILILSFHLRLGLTSGLFPSGFHTKTLYTPLLSLILPTLPAHLILLELITGTILHFTNMMYFFFQCSHQSVCHNINTSPTRRIKTHHITVSVITPHRPNNFKSQDFNNYPFLIHSYITCIILIERILWIAMEWWRQN